MIDCVFRRDGEYFIPTDGASSPWGARALHGGPPAGLLARAIEAMAPDPAMQVSRLTIDLFRAVPREPLAVRTEMVREGRRILAVQASLFAGSVEVSRATGLLLRHTEVELPDHHLPPGVAHPGPEGFQTTGLSAVMDADGNPVQRMSMLPGFHTLIEVRRVGGRPGSGRATAWIRIPVPLVEGEETTPLVRLAATSDFGNALGSIRASAQTGFINADITLYVHRLPVGEWICLDTVGAAQPHGVGLMQTTVYDAEGSVGLVAQAVLANQRV
ncbi:MAG: thioesterase family protein [Dehalococcoidia bacterium]|nr:thioesterase family protein [Dehalococcoidia bacterium]